jgi:hypothetical protein
MTGDMRKLSNLQDNPRSSHNRFEVAVAVRTSIVLLGNYLSHNELAVTEPGCARGCLLSEAVRKMHRFPA